MIDKKTIIETFKSEWATRELLLLLADYSDAEIESHRQEILHRYHLSEEDVK